MKWPKENQSGSHQLHRWSPHPCHAKNHNQCKPWMMIPRKAAHVSYLFDKKGQLQNHCFHLQRDHRGCHQPISKFHPLLVSRNKRTRYPSSHNQHQCRGMYGKSLSHKDNSLMDGKVSHLHLFLCQLMRWVSLLLISALLKLKLAIRTPIIATPASSNLPMMSMSQGSTQT